MRVRYFPYQPHCYAFGGFEVQMLSTFDASKAVGVEISKIDVWSKDLDFEIAHLWGLGLANFENIKWSSKNNKKIVVTALFSYFETLSERARFFVSSKIYKQRLFLELAGLVDKFVTVNEVQAEICHKFYGIPFSKIDVIPNIVKDSFFEYSTSLNESEDYVLTAGNVCHRKNQLRLAQACVKANLKLIILGNPIEGEEAYVKQLDDFIEANNNIRWIKGLQAGSHELIEYYGRCLLFALPSFEEQQPIALLEAGVLQKPLIISNRQYAKQSFYEGGVLVNPFSVDDIAEKLIKVSANPQKYRPTYANFDECKSLNVGFRYKELYEKML